MRLVALLMLAMLLTLQECTASNVVSMPGAHVQNPSRWAYRALFEVTTTSDWTATYLMCGANLAGYRLEIIEGGKAPKLDVGASLSKNSIWILKRSLDTTKVTIKATIALTNMTGNGRITFEILKGSLGFTSLILYEYNGQNPIEITAFMNSRSGSDKNSQSFSVTTDTLIQGKPQSIASGHYEKLVWAFYYPWYNTSIWSSPYVSDKALIGAYESSDANVIDKHIRMAKSAGIDGFIVSWCTDWCPNQNLDTILNVASRENFKITIYLESLAKEGWLGRPRAKASLESMLLCFFQRYGKDSRYYQIDGRPVVFVWAVDSQSVETWQDIIGNVSSSGYRGFYIGETTNINYLQVFNGIHLYGTLPSEDLLASTRALSLSVRSYGLLHAEQPTEKLWAATLTPGYDERKIPQRQGFSFPRDNGTTYQKTFDAALKSDPDWILITSFNEWYENTHIEPSETYGWKYIDLTTVYSSEFKDIRLVPSLKVSRMVSLQGQEGQLKVAVLNSGNGSAIEVAVWSLTSTANRSIGTTDRLLPGEEMHHDSPLNIPLGQSPLQLPPGEVTYKDAYGHDHRSELAPALLYRLLINSAYGSTSGAGWYEANTVARITVSPTAVPALGVAGFLGVRNVFEDWNGDVSAAAANTTIVMDTPKTVTALWSTDFTQLYIVVGIMIAVILVIAIVICIKKRNCFKDKESQLKLQ